jgi:hypothetical protein
MVRVEIVFDHVGHQDGRLGKILSAKAGCDNGRGHVQNTHRRVREPPKFFHLSEAAVTTRLQHVCQTSIVSRLLLLFTRR